MHKNVKQLKMQLQGKQVTILGFQLVNGKRFQKQSPERVKKSDNFSRSKGKNAIKSQRVKKYQKYAKAALNKKKTYS